ncbi:DUF4232 domain-containing protein [Streptomyces sp. NPDC053493]|uniref:DUF4232 domain-containing protein n=1 Tax=Streptomyces sp. NPDC053493 TaxID=3365705 RepID=UPI0037D0A342
MRTVVRRLALPAAVVSAALALTACQSHDGPASAVAPEESATASVQPVAPTTAPPGGPSTAPSAAGSTAPGAAPTAAPGGKGTARPTARPGAANPGAANPGAAKPGAARPAPASAGSTPCTAANSKVVASKVSRPVNHLLLTVTNVGSRPCDALGAPFVGFDDAQATVRVVEDSKPQAVVTLLPGESGYASLILTGEPGAGTRTVRTIKVYLTGESGTTVTAPSGTFADDGAAVSYWQRDLQDALTY